MNTQRNSTKQLQRVLGIMAPAAMLAASEELQRFVCSRRHEDEAFRKLVKFIRRKESPDGQP